MTMETILFIALLWMLVALSAAQVILAGRALWVERREGLAPSYRRFGAVAALSALVTAIGVGMTASAHPARIGPAPVVSVTPPATRPSQVAPPAVTAPAPTAPASAAAAQTAPPSAAPPAAPPVRSKELARLEKERAHYVAEIQRIDQEIDRLTQDSEPALPVTAAATVAAAATATATASATALGEAVFKQPPILLHGPVDDGGLPGWVVLAVACLVLVSAVLLLLLGDRDTIWLPAWLRRMGRPASRADDVGSPGTELEFAL